MANLDPMQSHKFLDDVRALTGAAQQRATAIVGVGLSLQY